MKSNVTIASNIYNRVNRDIMYDPKFVASVSESNALKKIKSQLGRMSSVKLSDWQEEIIREDQSCSLNRIAGRTDATHGLVKTEYKFVWACRCEYTACKNYVKCMKEPYAVRINRKIKYKTGVPETDNNPPLTFRYEHLGDITGVFKPQITDASYSEPEKAESFYTVDLMEKTGKYTKIESPDIIVKAPANSHTLVNAGPGTGKTYAIIKRLEHLAKTQSVEEYGSVLVLCYTNAAKNEIRKRLDEGIKSGELPSETRQFDIRTFDSLATAYLADIEDKDFTSLNYNERITRFNNCFDPEMFSLFEYVIIDELQDLVNERAIMTLNILKSLKGGWLLCGDKCQAIYDYDCDGDNKINSVEFYKQLEEIFPADVKRYEIIGNRRQNKSLEENSILLRGALLEYSPEKANDFFKNKIENYTTTKFATDTFSKCKNDLTTAILCRNNGEAEWISAKLHEADIRHNLLRSVVHHPTLNRWIADMFWDYCENQCGRSEFIERYRARIFDDEAAAENAFTSFINAEKKVFDKDIRDDILIMEDVKYALKRCTELDECLLNNPVEHLTVSTIHKAKGKEFDVVYLLNSFNPDQDTTDEARIWYVGATRPKQKMHVMDKLKKHFGKRTPTGRCVGMAFHRERYKNNKYSYATHVAVGFPEDYNGFSFVEGDFDQTISTQRYISENIKINDKVELILNSGLYDVIHKTQLIGRLSSEATHDIRAAIEKTDVKTNIPPFISNVFVSNIVTIIPYQYPSGIARMFRESGFWLGVELTGFGKIDWHYGGDK